MNFLWKSDEISQIESNGDEFATSEKTRWFCVNCGRLLPERAPSCWDTKIPNDDSNQCRTDPYRGWKNHHWCRSSHSSGHRWPSKPNDRTASPIDSRKPEITETDNQITCNFRDRKWNVLGKADDPILNVVCRNTSDRDRWPTARSNSREASTSMTAATGCWRRNCCGAAAGDGNPPAASYSKAEKSSALGSATAWQANSHQPSNRCLLCKQFSYIYMINSWLIIDKLTNWIPWLIS